VRLSRLALLALVLCAAPAVVWAALKIPPPPDHRINDYAGALDTADRERLEDKLRQRERGSSNQIVVAIFRSLEGESLEDYSVRLAQSWRIGRKGLDNGVVFLIFVNDRKMRIEVGYGLESNLTDAVSSSILRDVVAPRFREGRLADGISAGLDAIDQAIAGTYRGAPSPARRQPATSYWAIFLLLFVIAGLAWIIVPALLFSRATRRHGWTGGSSGWGGPFVGGGFFGGGGGGGGFSGGDFSGGGGGFGGGGASGSW
jgi:uncharacterized protein